LTNALRPKTKFVSVISSYGWAGRAVEQLTGLLDRLKARVLEPVIAKGYPKNTDFAQLDRLADDILAGHKELGIIK